MHIEIPKEHQPYHEDRPWGSFDTFANNAQCTVKILTIQQHERVSLQYHHKRDEVWRIIAGSGAVQVGQETHLCKVGDEFYIPRETIHRIEGGEEALQILEVSYGEYDEADIVRIEDDHGRE